MKSISVAISDDPKYCYDSTKKLCQFVGVSHLGTKWWCLLGASKRLYNDTEENGYKLMKCKECLFGSQEVKKE